LDCAAILGTRDRHGSGPRDWAYGFEQQPLERIEAYVFANNPASARVLEKTGFTYEGRLRRNVIRTAKCSTRCSMRGCAATQLRLSR
jgi:hypothetical protein